MGIPADFRVSIAEALVNGGQNARRRPGGGESLSEIACAVDCTRPAGHRRNPRLYYFSSKNHFGGKRYFCFLGPLPVSLLLSLRLSLRLRPTPLPGTCNWPPTSTEPGGAGNRPVEMTACTTTPPDLRCLHTFRSWSVRQCRIDLWVGTLVWPGQFPIPGGQRQGNHGGMGDRKRDGTIDRWQGLRRRSRWTSGRANKVPIYRRPKAGKHIRVAWHREDTVRLAPPVRSDG